MLNDYEGIHRPLELGLAAFIIPFAEALIKKPNSLALRDQETLSCAVDVTFSYGMKDGCKNRFLQPSRDIIMYFSHFAPEPRDKGFAGQLRTVGSMLPLSAAWTSA